MQKHSRLIAALFALAAATVASAAWSSYTVTCPVSTTGPTSYTVSSPNLFHRIVAYVDASISSGTVTFSQVADGSTIFSTNLTSGTNLCFVGDTLHGAYTITLSSIVATTNQPPAITFIILDSDDEQ